MFSLKQEGPDPSANAWLGNPEAMQGLQDRGALGKGEWEAGWRLWGQEDHEVPEMALQ